MADIVERLREGATRIGYPWRDVLAEAADLIEQQRAQLAIWKAAEALQRGSMAERDSSAFDEAVLIVPAEPNTPR